MEEENNNKSEKLKSTAKSTFKKTYKAFFKFKFFRIALIFILITVVISALIWWIFDDEGIWEDDETGKPSNYTESSKMSTTDGIVVDREEMITDTLDNKGFTEEEIENLTEEEIIDIFDMEKKLGRDINSLDECTEAEILWCTTDEYERYLEKPEHLEYLLDAELVTQYPKIESIGETNKNGRIEFKRIFLDPDTMEETELILEYIPNEDFETKFQEYISSGNKDVFKFFTLDDEQNAIIAKWTVENGVFSSSNTVNQDRKKINAGYDIDRIKNDFDSRYELAENGTDLIKATYVEYKADKVPINYKSIMQKYTLPFEYLWSLLVMGESYDFVEGLAQLAYDSEIYIGIYDNVTVTENINKKDYTENFRERYERKENYRQVEDTGWTDPIEQYTYYEENKQNIKTNIPIIDLSYADTWIVEVSTTYEKVITPPDSPPIVNNIGDENWSDNGTTDSTWVDIRSGEVPRRDADGNIMLDADGNQIMDTYHYKVHVDEKFSKEKKLTNQVNTTSIAVERNEYEKVATEVKEKTDINADKDNFPKLLRNDKRAYGLLTNDGVIVWLKDILIKNKNTKDKVELTLYLINKTRDPDNTELHYDFSIFEPSNFNSITVIYGNSIEEKVWFALKNLGYSDIAVAGAMGNIHHESGGFNPAAVEKGVESGGIGLIQWTDSRRTQLEAYAISKEVSWTDVDTQIEFLVAEISGQGPANGYATRRTVGSIKEEGIVSTHDQWADSTTVEDATLHFMRFFESPGSRSSYETRCQHARNYLMQFEGRTMAVAGSSSIVESAIQVHQYVRINGYYYSQAGICVPNYSTKTIDCSSYVTWVLVNAGVPGFVEGMHQQSSAVFRSNPWAFQEVRMDQAQPGDIAVYSGHVEIIAANDLGSQKFRVYNCGGNASISAAGTADLPESSTSGHTKSSAIKILRVGGQ